MTSLDLPFREALVSIVEDAAVEADRPKRRLSENVG
jgi:hypothetical protein